LDISKGFQPEFEEEFPTSDGPPKIPHHLHQIWISDGKWTQPSLPSTFIPTVRSFLQLNPKWKYFFWTEKNGRQLIKDKYQKLLKFFDTSTLNVVKADLLRYVVLHEYGGLYADLDTLNVRPLDRVTQRFSCILVLEPFENAVLWESSPYKLCNGEMFCRPKHPFLQKLLSAVEVLKPKSFTGTMIGPPFVTAKFREYKNMPKTTQIYRKRKSSTPYFFHDDDTTLPPEDDIYVPNTRFFLDSPSPALRRTALSTCANPNITNQLIARMCYVVKMRGFDRKPGKFTFLTHQFAHSWSPANTKHMKHVTPIAEVVAAENFTCDASEGRCQHRNAQIG